MSRWFRLYDELVDDPKWIKLGPDLKAKLIELWCITSKNFGKIPCVDDVAISWRISGSRARRLLDELKHSGWIDETKQGLIPHNWNERQYKSDVSTERVKRFRKRFETVSETAPDTDTESDTDKKKETSLREVKKESGRARKKRGPLPEGWSPNQTHHDLAGRLSLILGDEEAKFRDYLASNAVLYADYDAAFRTFLRNAPKFNGRGSNGRSLQDGRLSVGAAIDRLAERNQRGEFSFGPAPSLLPAERQNNLRVLPKGRSA